MPYMPCSPGKVRGQHIKRNTCFEFSAIDLAKRNTYYDRRDNSYYNMQARVFS